jgi:hypothetical protein
LSQPDERTKKTNECGNSFKSMSFWVRAADARITHLGSKHAAFGGTGLIRACQRPYEDRWPWLELVGQSLRATETLRSNGWDRMNAHCGSLLGIGATRTQEQVPVFFFAAKASARLRPAARPDPQFLGNRERNIRKAPHQQSQMLGCAFGDLIDELSIGAQSEADKVGVAGAALSERRAIVDIIVW